MMTMTYEDKKKLRDRINYAPTSHKLPTRSVLSTT